MWFSTEGEQRLKDSYPTDDTQACTEKDLEHFHMFLTQSKVSSLCNGKEIRDKKTCPLLADQS